MARLPKFEHPVRSVLAVGFVGVLTAMAVNEHRGQSQEQLASIINDRGRAILGGAAISLDGLERGSAKRPEKFGRKPRAILGEEHVITAQNRLLEEQGKTRDDLDALALSSCFLAAANAPDYNNVQNTLKEARDNFESGQQEVAAAQCTDYLVGLLATGRDLTTITGLSRNET